MKEASDSTLKYWVLAARPKTLPASIIPVLVASVLAYKNGKFDLIPALICLIFALLAQIVSNFLNDYFDFVKGSDRNDRLGPERAVAKGWIGPRQMLNGAIILLVISCILGSFLIYYAGWEMILVGIGVCMGVFAYSAGPYPLSYHGWGDFCVIFFYGLIPVGFTYYVQALDWSLATTLCGISLGLVSTNILVANNYRDRAEDKKSGKNTTIVLFGEPFGRWFYLFNGIIAVLICLYFTRLGMSRVFFCSIPYLIFHIKTWNEMCTIREGRELNVILAQSARNTIIFGLLLSAGILLS